MNSNAADTERIAPLVCLTLVCTVATAISHFAFLATIVIAGLAFIGFMSRRSAIQRTSTAMALNLGLVLVGAGISPAIASFFGGIACGLGIPNAKVENFVQRPLEVGLGISVYLIPLGALVLIVASVLRRS